MKEIVGVVEELQESVAVRGEAAFNLQTAFDERAFLTQCMEYVKRSLGLQVMITAYSVKGGRASHFPNERGAKGIQLLLSVG